MTKTEKVVFINEIMETLRGSLIQKVELMPEEWDGHELRQLIADIVNEEVVFVHMNKGRLREYKNTRITKNI